VRYRRPIRPPPHPASPAREGVEFRILSARVPRFCDIKRVRLPAMPSNNISCETVAGAFLLCHSIGDKDVGVAIASIEPSPRLARSAYVLVEGIRWAQRRPLWNEFSRSCSRWPGKRHAYHRSPYRRRSWVSTPPKAPRAEAGASGGAPLLLDNPRPGSCGLELRHDHGSQYLSADLRNEIRFLGIQAPRLCVHPRATAALNAPSERSRSSFFGWV